MKAFLIATLLMVIGLVHMSSEVYAADKPKDNSKDAPIVIVLPPLSPSPSDAVSPN